MQSDDDRWSWKRARAFLGLGLFFASQLAIVGLVLYWLVAGGWAVIAIVGMVGYVITGIVTQMLKNKYTAVLAKWIGYALIALVCIAVLGAMYDSWTGPYHCVETRYVSC